MKHLAKTILTATLFVPQFLQFSLAQTVTNRQPVIDMSAPDPTVIRAEDGTFYLYATEDMRNVPIFHSANLVDWKLVGTAFTDNSRPKWLPKGGIWAPDIQRVGGKYHLYYAKSVWGGEWDAGIGVAVSNNPAGPFVDRGCMFTSKQIGIQNCIDPFYIEDGGKKYLFFGSFHGIYGVELTADGLHVKQGAKPREVAGTFMEATYIRRRGGYYYLFGSTGTCCEGARSTYRITIGRSKSLFGPYVDKTGLRLLDNHYNILLDKDDSVLGPGHNAGLITDDAGNDYMLYHGFKASDPDAGRVVWLSRIVWADGWPSMMMEKDSQKNETVPVIKSDNRGVATRSGLYPNDFEANIEGKRTHLYTLSNSKGMEVCLTNFGARIVSIMVPDRRGTLRDVVLGYDNIAQYADYQHFGSDFGAAIGRYANRINQGRIIVDGKTVQLPLNNYGHCLHGGFTGWQYQVYDGKQLNDSTVEMSLVSPDGDNGFPGTVRATVRYTLTADNAIDIRYEATTDKKTVINMTNHSYFNLNGNPSQHCENQLLYINADRYTPADTTYMPTGQMLKVAGTPMDFRKPTPLSKDINNQRFAMTRNAHGFDHNWCLNTWHNGQPDESTVAASLYSPKTGIMLQVFTNEPGMQVYTGNFLDASFAGKHGYRYPKHSAVCMETQHYPDSPNHPEWPNVWLETGKKYSSHCIYKFSVQ
ncbi:aldose epimerase [Prevotella sp. HMSC069G02]|nr:aldose epimerase [Prevotella sp. HMSC069G02]